MDVTFFSFEKVKIFIFGTCMKLGPLEDESTSGIFTWTQNEDNGEALP
jgi:hypothetical protein